MFDPINGPFTTDPPKYLTFKAQVLAVLERLEKKYFCGLSSGDQARIDLIREIRSEVHSIPALMLGD
jgi:hypothetical protein